MKALFITILVFAAAFCAYDYFGAPVGQKMIFKSLNVAEDQVAAPAPATPPPAKTPEATPPAVQDLATPSAPATAATSPPPPPPAPAPVKDPTAPKFESIESLTKNWTFIPKSAFPRQVQLKKALDFKMSVGSSTLNAGSTVTALGFEQGALALAPTPSSSARATAALDDTDLKSILNEGYEKWKVARTEMLKKAQAQRLANKASGMEPPTPAGDPSQAPARSSDGSYPLLVSNLNSGEVNELKAKNIHRWGDPESMHFEGKPAWAVKVMADVETVFGLQPAEAQAIIVGGRVKGWFYTGSGEPVP
jgi:hypothetical protein